MRAVRPVAALVLAAGALLHPGVALADDGDVVRDLAVRYDVQKDGSVRVTETYRYEFAGEAHGPERTLVVRQDVDGDAGRHREYALSGVSASSPSGAPATVDVTDEGVTARIRVGDPATTVTGPQQYVLHYTLAHVLNPQRPAKAAELYWNVTGDSWTVPLEHVGVVVHGPAATTKATCTQGPTGSTTPCTARPGRDATFEAGPLQPGEQMTIATQMPLTAFGTITPALAAGTVSGVPGDAGVTPDPGGAGGTDGTGDAGDAGDAGDPGVPMGGAGAVDDQAPVVAVDDPTGDSSGLFGPLVPALALVPLAPVLAFGAVAGLLVTAGVLRTRAGRIVSPRDQERFLGVPPDVVPDDPDAPVTRGGPEPVPTVRFTPPDGVGPGLVGTVIDGRADPVDVSAALIDLAVRGYLRIEEVPRRFLGSTDWRLVRLRPADGSLRVYETTLLAGLFARGDAVYLSDLRNRFAPVLARVQDELTAEARARGWYRTEGRVLPRRVLTATGAAYREQARGFREYLLTAEAHQIAVDEAQMIFGRYLPYAVVFGCADRWARVFAAVARAAEEQGVRLAPPPTLVWAGADDLARFGEVGGMMSGFASAASATFVSTPSGSATSGSSGGSAFGGGGSSDSGSSSAGGGGGGGGGGSW